MSYIRQTSIVKTNPCNIKGQECLLCDLKFEGSFDYKSHCPNKGRKALDILAPKLRKWCAEYEERRKKNQLVDVDELLKGLKK